MKDIIIWAAEEKGPLLCTYEYENCWYVINGCWNLTLDIDNKTVHVITTGATLSYDTITFASKGKDYNDIIEHAKISPDPTSYVDILQHIRDNIRQKQEIELDGIAF